uniref:Neurotransmitter-gated ion-channel ligand-binding domain-containing protein n=1 Tax=Glossina palpalis gambiensis TaxID=67801 RepID=A0A1B0AUT5_9MUSC
MFISGPWLVSRLAFLIYGLIAFSATSVYCDDENDETNSWNITVMERLRMQLFTNYDKNAYPLISSGIRTNVSMGLSIIYTDIDEFDGKVMLHGWLHLRWQDEDRTWTPELFDNITTIHISPNEVWKPEITLFNSAGNEADYIGETQIVLTFEGKFIWVPPVLYTAYCNLNLKLWPYDVQICELKIGSWTWTQIDSSFVHFKETLDYKDIVESSEWEIIDARIAYHMSNFYNYIEYTFQLERRSSMYTAVIFTPASCIVLLTLSSFWLPVQMGEKILLNGVMIVIVAGFLMYFAQLLPILAENTPLVVLFYSASLLLLSFSTIIAVIVLYLSTTSHKQRVPKFIQNILHGSLGRILLLTQFTVEAEPPSLLNNGIKEMGEHVYDSVDAGDVIADGTTTSNTQSFSITHNRSIQFEWTLLSTAIDRIWFLIFCVIFILLATIYAV